MDSKLSIIKQESYLNDLLDRFAKIGQLTTQSQQMAAVLGLQSFLTEIWNDGYSEGLKDDSKTKEIVFKNPNEN